MKLGEMLESKEIRLKLLRLLEKRTQINQRVIASELKISLGKTNYCLKALIKKGFIKTKSFINNRHKSAYAYILTPYGIKEKSILTVHFLKRKKAEYENLQIEIKYLNNEIRILRQQGLLSDTQKTQVVEK